MSPSEGTGISVESGTILKFFAQRIETELGIIYAEHNYFQLEKRLEEIARLQGVSCIRDLYALAQKGISGAFKQLLLDVATNNETSFFRDPKIFKALEACITSGGPWEEWGRSGLRIWSAAASTGQEASSLAILFEELRQRTGFPSRWSILGTDISERALARARSGTYTSLEVQRGLSAALLVKHFSQVTDPASGDQWVLKEALKSTLQWVPLNLKDKFLWPAPFHIVFCRNVLIYQSVESKKDILERIRQCLAPGGLLVLGAGESLLGLSDQFEQKTLAGAVLYQRR